LNKEERAYRRRPNLQKYELVLVTWKDHSFDDTDWVLRKDIPKLPLVECVSAGFRISDDDKKIILAASLSGEFAGGLLVIGKSMVEKIVPTHFTAKVDKRVIACSICNELGESGVCPAEEFITKEGESKNKLLKELAILRENAKRTVSEEETNTRFLRVAKILEEQGIKKENICSVMTKMVPYSARWIQRMLPKEYKKAQMIKAHRKEKF